MNDVIIQVLKNGRVNLSANEIGYNGENDARKIIVQLEADIEDGVAVLEINQHNKKYFLSMTEEEDGSYTLPIYESLLAYSEIEMQFRIIKDENVIIKSEIFKLKVDDSINAIDKKIPEEYTDWFLEVNNQLKELATKDLELEESIEGVKTDLETNYTKTEELEQDYAKKTDIASVYKYKGSVDKFEDLKNKEAEAVTGDVWDVKETGDNYAWNGSEWDDLGGEDVKVFYMELYNLDSQANKDVCKKIIERIKNKKYDNLIVAKLDTIDQYNTCTSYRCSPSSNYLEMEFIRYNQKEYINMADAERKAYSIKFNSYIYENDTITKFNNFSGYGYLALNDMVVKSYVDAKDIFKSITSDSDIWNLDGSYVLSKDLNLALQTGSTIPFEKGTIVNANLKDGKVYYFISDVSGKFYYGIVGEDGTAEENGNYLIDLNKVLTTDNTFEYEVTEDYNPAHKKYVDTETQDLLQGLERNLNEEDHSQTIVNVKNKMGGTELVMEIDNLDIETDVAVNGVLGSLKGQDLDERVTALENNEKFKIFKIISNDLSDKTKLQELLDYKIETGYNPLLDNDLNNDKSKSFCRIDYSDTTATFYFMPTFYASTQTIQKGIFSQIWVYYVSVKLGDNHQITSIESTWQKGFYPLVGLNATNKDVGFGDRIALTLANSQEYTPKEDYNPATKKYVDDAVINSGEARNVIFLPSQLEISDYQKMFDYYLETGHIPLAYGLGHRATFSGRFLTWIANNADNKEVTFMFTEIPAPGDLTLEQNVFSETESQRIVLTYDDNNQIIEVKSGSNKTGIFLPLMGLNTRTKTATDRYERIALSLNNSTEYTPTKEYHPATKKYVDDLIASSGGGTKVFYLDSMDIDSAENKQVFVDIAKAIKNNEEFNVIYVYHDSAGYVFNIQMNASEIKKEDSMYKNPYAFYFINLNHKAGTSGYETTDTNPKYRKCEVFALSPSYTKNPNITEPEEIEMDKTSVTIKECWIPEGIPSGGTIGKITEDINIEDITEGVWQVEGPVTIKYNYQDGGSGNNTVYNGLIIKIDNDKENTRGKVCILYDYNGISYFYGGKSGKYYQNNIAYSKFVATNNTQAFEVSGNYNLAHKKYVDDSIAAAVTGALEGSY